MYTLETGYSGMEGEVVYFGATCSSHFALVNRDCNRRRIQETALMLFFILYEKP